MQFVRNIGAAWAGGSEKSPPEKLDSAIIFASVDKLVPAALKAFTQGGIVVFAGIHMSDIPSFLYRVLWENSNWRLVTPLQFNCNIQKLIE